MKQKGRIGREWDVDRAKYIEENPPDWRGMYECWFGDGEVHIDDVSLEHIENRSTRPDLRRNMGNLAPAHGICNMYKRPMMHTIR